MRDGQLLPVLLLSCYHCHATTRWVLNEAGTHYVCKGDILHPERRLHGCGRMIERNYEHVRLVTKGGDSVA